MINLLTVRLRTTLVSWLASGAFWKTLVGGMAISLAAKALVNWTIEPIPLQAPMSSLEGQIFPFPPGLFAITHSQHWADAGLESLVVIGWALMMAYLFLSLTTRAIHHRIAYMGTGLFIAGVISNRGEVAIFGHATDFLFVRLVGFGGLAAVVNFADLMIFSGLVLLLLWSPLYRLLICKRQQREKNAA